MRLGPVFVSLSFTPSNCAHNTFVTCYRCLQLCRAIPNVDFAIKDSCGDIARRLVASNAADPVVVLGLLRCFWRGHGFDVLNFDQLFRRNGVLFQKLLQGRADELSVDQEVERLWCRRVQQMINHLTEMAATNVAWHSDRSVRDDILGLFRDKLNANVCSICGLHGDLALHDLLGKKRRRSRARANMTNAFLERPSPSAAADASRNESSSALSVVPNGFRSSPALRSGSGGLHGLEHAHTHTPTPTPTPGANQGCGNGQRTTTNTALGHQKKNLKNERGFNDPRLGTQAKVHLAQQPAGRALRARPGSATPPHTQ
eukprot:m.173794 g.173794  ORF g.173794 m.173794 type:complete len:315 (+) comp53278_c0_seq1:909-1853(+)